MKIPFREHHLLQLLDSYEQASLPIDAHIASYFRAHRALGSRDRAHIADAVYSLFRWRGLLDYLSKKPVRWSDRWETYQAIDINELQKRDDLPEHVKVSFPRPLFDLLVKHFGNAKAVKLCLCLNTQAPITIRANALKISRDELRKLLSDQLLLVPCSRAQCGITLKKRAPLFATPEFQKGYFEMQDEASQLAALHVRAKPKDLVLDYCAGSGGKTLAFAPQMENQGQIFLHDIREGILKEAKRRLRRAGVQNAQIVLPESKKLSSLKKKMDWVLVDAPCSGTGTYRRNPDMKWSFSEEMLARLIGEQRSIFEKALSFVKPKGKIIYATCSILPEENSSQIEHFLHTYPVSLAEPPFISLPEEGSMDGFFAAVFEKTC